MSSDINVQTFSGKVNITSNLLVGTSHLFVDTINNRVGLVTNTPDAGLHVNSNAYVHTDFRVGSGIVMNDTAGQITAGSFVGDGSAMTGINSDSGSWVNGTDVVYLSTTTDKVGIGYTNPLGKLYIAADYDHTLQRPSSSSNHYLVLSKTGAQVVDEGPGISFCGSYNGSNDYQDVMAEIRGVCDTDGGRRGRLEFWTSSSDGINDVDTQAMTIKSNGNVGIGTTSPGNTLEVAGTATVAILKSAADGATSTYNFILNGPRPGTSSSGAVHFINGSTRTGDGGVSTYTIRNDSGTLRLGNASYNTLIEGNVGIGTTGPGRPLDVHFTGDTGIRAKNTGSTHASVYIDSASGYSYLRFQSSGAEKFWIQSTPTGDLAFRPSGSGHVMDIKNNGNVGIGATDPNHKLEVSGGILADYIAIPEINLHGARIGHVIEYRYSGMPSTAPTDESSMNSEFGQRHSSSIATNTQMRYPAGTAATNIGRMWIGIIQATSTGVYTFGVNSDDASDLFVAGYRVADWYAGHGHNSSNINIPGGNQRTIYLKGGQWYKVKARFEENGGGEAFFALWKKPGDTSFSEIPSGNLAYILSDHSSAPTSDDRLKVNETMISNATDTIIKLKPQIYDKFEFIEDVHDTKNKPTRESGLIAQDIWYDAPELRHMVYPYKTPNETREVNEDIQQDPDYSDWGPVAAQVNYFGLIPYLIKSFQELHEKVTSEKVKTKNLEALVLSLITRVQKLEAR
jgi:hypothetical protein